jgi:outer membrane protein assembly factor BamB
MTPHHRPVPFFGSILLLAAALATPGWAEETATSDNNWPSYRGIDANGRAPGSTVSEWNGETGKNVLFKARIEGLAHSSPVIWGDILFLTTAVSASGEEASLKLGLYGDIKPVDNEGPQQFKVIAIDKNSGERLWAQVAYEGEPAIKRHTKATHANSTAATDGKRVVVFFGSEGLYSFDMNGKLEWKKDFGVLDSGFFMAKTAQWGFASSPILHGDKVIVQVDVQENSFVAALDAETGDEVWRTPRTEVPTWSTPAVVPQSADPDSPDSQKYQVVLNGWKHIGGYDLETGKELWKLAGGGDIPVPTPLYENGLILITNAHGRDRPIYAIRPSARGEITVESDAMAWHVEKRGNYMQTPIVLDGIGYFCFDNGVLSAYDLDTGETLYQERLGAGQSGFTSSPVAADGKIYITNEDGDTYVVKAGRTFELLATNELGETMMATPAISDGVIYFRAREHLFAIGAAGD